LILKGENQHLITTKGTVSYSEVFDHDFSANILVFQPHLVIGAQEEVDRPMPEISWNFIKINL
jgi:hypothetical protein